MAAATLYQVFFLSPSSCNLTSLTLRMHGKVRQTPRWWQKVHDAHILSKWRAEMVEHLRVLVGKLRSGDEAIVAVHHLNASPPYTP